MNFIVSGLGVFLTTVLVIAGMVLLYLKVIPKKFDGSFKNKAFQLLHDYFNFKELYIESVLKFLFTLVTVVSVASGISIIITSFLGIFQNIGYVIDYGMSFGRVISSFFTGVVSGLATIIVGPIAIRLVYEGIMMFILLVKNVIEINNKTKNSDTNSDNTAE